MIKITIGNSFSRIEGLSPKLEKELRSALSYEVGSYFSGSRFSGKRTLLGKKGDFPTGLATKVWEFLENKKVKDQEYVDSRIEPKSNIEFVLNIPLSPYTEQLDAVYEAVRRGRGTISMPTGTGKSVTMAMLVAAMGLKTLIVVPNLGLKTQLQESFESWFPDMSNITIENIDSKSLKTAKNYDCLIIDEAHHAAARTYRNLNKTVWSVIYHRFFFTATPFRSLEEESLLLQSITGDIIFKLSYAKAVSLKRIVPVEAYYFELPKNLVASNSWPTVYSELVVNNKYRNQEIASMLTSLKDAGKSTLCLVKEIKHGHNIAVLSSCEFAHAQDDLCQNSIERFNKGSLRSLIGTTGVIGEGVDTKPAEYIIIAGLGKSKNAFMQQVGRGVRSYAGKESCKVILFKDASHKFTLRHFKEQCKILKEEYGTKPIKIN